MNNLEISRKVKELRLKNKMNLRTLGKSSGISPAMISMIENNRVNPTLSTLRKILDGLETNFAEFFSGSVKDGEVFYFPRNKMKIAVGKGRNYTILFPRRKEIKMELLLEEISPADKPEMEIHKFDVAGLIVDGGPMKLEIADSGEWLVHKGDAFYVPAGKAHRGINIGKKKIRMVTSFYPPRY